MTDEIRNSLQASHLLDALMAQVCAQSPVIKKTLENFSQASLADYLRQILVVCDAPLQPRDDLLTVIYRYATPLLGKVIAESVVRELHELPVVLTANHHGVDFLAQSTQGGFIFALREVSGRPASTVPVFACGNVALNNPTYPRGLLLYCSNPQATEFSLPIKLPIFSERLKRKSVSIVGGYDAEMLAQTEKRLAVMVQNQSVTSELAIMVETILKEDYRDNFAISLKSYSQQAVVLNNRIWKRCFRDQESAPEMVYLELEKIAVSLLELDLNNEDSLLWQIMFNPTLRERVIEQLDGIRTCWNQGRLAERSDLCAADRQSGTNGCGTMFFWGIDDAGWRVPLLLVGDGKTLTLEGRDDRGKLWVIPFNPHNILKELRMGGLLPSLFTCYSSIAFARGFSCCGGYFQADYLPSIQHGLMRAMDEVPDCVGLSKRLSQVPSDIYLSGMQAVMCSLNDEFLLPVGPIEIIASGGLTKNQLEQMRMLTVQDAHLAGLTETLQDFESGNFCLYDWHLNLAKESLHVLKDQMPLLNVGNVFVKH